MEISGALAYLLAPIILFFVYQLVKRKVNDSKDDAELKEYIEEQAEIETKKRVEEAEIEKLKEDVKKVDGNDRTDEEVVDYWNND